jgi:hypothetical protein
MPMGNRLPMIVDKKLTDAHNIKGITMEDAIDNISVNMDKTIAPEELMLRRQIVTSVLITMGRKITHFEGNVDPVTGTLDVDWTFSHIISDDEHLSDLKQVDPHDIERKFKDCVVMRAYCADYDPNTGDKFSHLLGCETVDLCSLMQQSIDVCTPGKINPEDNRKYDFPLRTNFCNTFVIASVIPMWGEAVCTMKEVQTKRCVHGSDFHVSTGLAVRGEDVSLNHSKIITEMREHLLSMRSNLKKYEDAEAVFKSSSAPFMPPHSNPQKPSSDSPDRIKMDISSFSIVPSVLRKLPHIQTMVKLQQALQQVYCAHGVESSDAVLSEPNTMMYSTGSTSLQLHQASACFGDISQINNNRGAPVTMAQIMVQMYTAMIKTGLTHKDVQEMKASTHEDDLIAFMNTVISVGQMDQKQCPYTYDNVIHSVMPVAEHIAVANLKPVPGTIEYAPGCHDCYYKKHSIYSTTQGKCYDQWYR